MKSPSYKPDKDHNADCSYEYEREPCWGQVEMVEDDDDHVSYACEGHMDYAMSPGSLKYITEKTS